MAETLGSLCDKLTVVKLKQYHSNDEDKLNSLHEQEEQLKSEINCFMNDALSGNISSEQLFFSSNKIYKQEGNEIKKIEGNIGLLFSELARVNCELWHEQEKVYEFEKVPVCEKDKVVKKLALLNLERTQNIDAIDKIFKKIVENCPNNI